MSFFNYLRQVLWGLYFNVKIEINGINFELSALGPYLLYDSWGTDTVRVNGSTLQQDKTQIFF